ncbi:HVA1 family protein [Amycolatopsis sp. lyj-84]
MTQRFKRGDRVRWNSHGGEAEGVVLKEIIHKPDVLEKI